MIVEIPIVASLLLGACLIWLSVEDIRHLSFSIPALAFYWVVALVVSWFLHRLAWPYLATGLVLGAGFLALNWLFERRGGGPGLGAGDAVLVAGAGVMIGPLGAPQLVLMAALAGLVVMGTLRSTGTKRPKLLPFGPFLAVVTWILFLEGPLIL